jgi:hypothetical protein
MNAAAVKSTGVETMKSARVETATVKSTSVKTATTVEAASVEPAAVTTATMTAATSRISQVGDRCCHNRGRNDRDKRQQHIAGFEHTTLHPFHGGPESRQRKRFTGNTPGR